MNKGTAMCNAGHLIPGRDLELPRVENCKIVVVRKRLDVKRRATFDILERLGPRVGVNS